MRKLGIIALSLSALNVFAWEVQIKSGYDFYRGRSKDIKISANSTHNLSEPGFTLGLEFIPFNKSFIEVGFGTEYNFGTTHPLYTKTQNTHQNDSGYTIPIYTLIKGNLLRNDTNTQALYTFGRIGYAFSADKAEKSYPKNSGFYFGAGLGFEIKYFVFEGLYEAIYHYSAINGSSIHNIDHKTGIRTGIRFGDFSKKKPVIVKPIIPVKSSVKTEEPNHEPKIYKTHGKLINASCDEATKKCIIHGFAADGGAISAEEQEDIKEIATLINDFIGKGYVEIVGHTDSKGSDAYNINLSFKRAQNIAKLLQESGLTNDIKISIISGRGESEPIATNDTEEGRYLNRRVEIKFSDVELVKME
ncbi:OmpA family protein [Caviibacter abscessus]|uniref:OmpA family protein n=1 Tax=Caviibacter abscessus TaxID=1766719 RepID=UPI0008335C75|nr:OmpA family protein [Caviibacter abscessus]